MFKDFIRFVRDYYGKEDELIPLHAPVFRGNERKYVIEALDSTFVSSVGPFVDKLEQRICSLTGAKFAVAVVNGTAGLHMALYADGVGPGDEVITQPLSFVALANAITYTGAKPVFLDVDPATLSLSPEHLRTFLRDGTEFKNGKLTNKKTGGRLACCMPMHTFGFPARIEEIIEICNEHSLPVIEDASESIGSFYKNKHTGTFGKAGVFSFNGNKTITSGGGGVIITNEEPLARKMKHLTTTAKKPHRWEFQHDMLGFNYRLPNINAALAFAQLEQLESFISEKRELAVQYCQFFSTQDTAFFTEPEHSKSNYWLNAILLSDRQEQHDFLQYTNDRGIGTRPAWQLLNTLPMYENCPQGDLSVAEGLANRIVNIPSGVRQ